MKGAVSVLWVLLGTLVPYALGLYDHSDDVYELTPSNFQTVVVDSDFVWLVEFYAPWCGHCQALAPEYKKAASALKGIVRVGAMDLDQHKGFGQQFNIRGFPTIKVFGADKRNPTDYAGARTADAMVTEALRAAKDTATGRLGGKKTSSGGKTGSGSGGGSGGKVIELTDSNFEELVINSDEPWLVEFFAPWCGHCKNLAPHWASAAAELSGKVNLGALDATVHNAMASRYQVQGFPTIKFFPAGKKTWDSAEPYNGGRTSSDIVQWALEKWVPNIPPPEIYQLTSQDVFDECTRKQLCMVAFLPHILDSGAAGRNGYIETLRSMGEKYKSRFFGWVWTEGGTYLDLEQNLDIGGFGYPALSTVNSRKSVYSLLRGSFSEDGISEFVRELVGQRGITIRFKGDLPTLETTEPWDGKDGELPVEDDDWDLSDFDMDAEEPPSGRDEL